MALGGSRLAWLTHTKSIHSILLRHDRPKRRGDIVKVVVEKRAVDAGDRANRPPVSETSIWVDAVDEARILIGNHVLAHRASGATVPNRVTDWSVVLDDVFFDHHQRL